MYLPLVSVDVCIEKIGIDCLSNCTVVVSSPPQKQKSLFSSHIKSVCVFGEYISEPKMGMLVVGCPGQNSNNLDGFKFLFT